MTDVQEDLEAIERLHQKDMAASKAGDFSALRSLMADDAVVLPPGGHPVRGKEDLDASFDRTESALKLVEVFDYGMEFEEVKVVGDYAFEWGWIKGSMRSKGSEEVVNSTHKFLRILQKQPDGDWKVYRSIWNDVPASGPK